MRSRIVAVRLGDDVSAGVIRGCHLFCRERGTAASRQHNDRSSKRRLDRVHATYRSNDKAPCKTLDESFPLAHIIEVPGRGRPKKPKGTVKDETLVLRVTPSEKEEIASAAQKAGAGGASAWVRQLALTAARKAKV